MSEPDPWEELARQARELGDLAEKYGARTPADLAPHGDSDPLAEMDTLALEVRGAVAACRRATYQALVDEGHTKAAIGRMWKKAGRASVTNALTQQHRRR